MIKKKLTGEVLTKDQAGRQKCEDNADRRRLQYRPPNQAETKHELFRVPNRFPNADNKAEPTRADNKRKTQNLPVSLPH